VKQKAEIAHAKKRFRSIASVQRASEVNAALQEAQTFASAEEQLENEDHKAKQLPNQTEFSEKREKLRKLIYKHEDIERTKREGLDSELSTNDSGIERFQMSLQCAREADRSRTEII
jgi:hypothetical protein